MTWPSAAADATTPTIIGGGQANYTGVAQKIVTNLPAGMKYAISTTYIDPTKIDAGKIVPAGYTALDYLEGTGTQYINAGLPASCDTRVVIDAKFNNTNIQQRLFGASLTGGFWYEIYITGGKKFGYEYNDDKYNDVNTGVDADTERHLFDLNGVEKTLQIDQGETYSSALQYTSATKNSGATLLHIFTRCVGSSDVSGNYACANVYSCQIYENGALQRDFVPVRGAKGELGMYDLVENKLYTNDGTGEFIAGEAVNTAVQDWEWANSIDDPNNEIVLAANTKYYVYYYTPTSNTATASPLKVCELNVTCTEHVYGDWVITKQPTCTSTGERTRTCQGCGDIVKEILPVIDHNYVAAFDPITGNTTYTCQVCGDHYANACLDDLGHTFHDTVVDPSCETVGYTEHVCERCNYTYRSDSVAATGHHFGDWHTVTEPTATATGTAERECANCGASEQKNLAALGLPGGTTTTTPTPTTDNNGGQAWLIFGIVAGGVLVLGSVTVSWLFLGLSRRKKQAA